MVVVNNHNVSIRHDKGGALLIFMFVLAIGTMAALLSVLDSNQIKAERIKANAITLANAKEALVGNSVAVNGTQRPGLMIKPDSFATGELPLPGNYDGSADSGCLDVSKANGFPLIGSGNINMRCLGRLPWKDLGLSVHGVSQEDASGLMPWYAVSANLVDPTCLGVLNPHTLNLTNNPVTLNCTGTALPYPWLTVRDGRGNVVSNRVAAVIIVPNEAHNGQMRTLLPLGMANQYLDALVIPVGCAAPCVPGTYSNADMDNDYIFSEEGNPIAATSQFNDQLAYITIDELMATIDRRVAGEVRSQLQAYYAANGYFPDAATVGYQSQSCVQGQAAGFLPLPILTCTGSKCDGAFPATIKFTSDVNFSASSGACTYIAAVCSCTGLGSCTKASPKRAFGCSSTGTCISLTTGNFNYAPSTPIDNSSLVVTGGACVVAGTGVDCTGAGHVKVNGSVNGCSTPMLNVNGFPSWFTENGWKHFIYYAKGNLTVGAKNASALVLTTGPSLAAQLRPSNLIADYLDSVENTNHDAIYDAIGTRRTSTYNDQMIIVAP